VTAARGFVRETLLQRPQAVVDAAELMACELATNCVQHARTDFELVIDDRKGEIRVELRDAGHGRPKLRSPTAVEPSGRGLCIVQALSKAWGVVPGEVGTRVWFTLDSESGVRTAREPMRCSR
jgi:anti-sigma regulatory factor (Ser/Thr protein kinase)